MTITPDSKGAAAKTTIAVIRERLEDVIRHVKEFQKDILTEEAAKTAFILPFVHGVLGYNVFNPLEVIPEFNADVGTKKGEKVDYAIVQNGNPVIIIECKGLNEHLTLENAAQLFRYFTVTPARIGILTNGIVYKFYSDTEEVNKMDMKPFLEFDLLSISLNDEELLTRIQRFSKDHFDLDDAAKAAIEIKYIEGMRQYLFAQIDTPSDEFVAHVAGVVFPGRKTAKVVEQFRPMVRKAFQTFISDRVSQVVKAMNIAAHNSSLSTDTTTADVVIQTGSDADTGKEIVTTAEELEGFYIVKGILRVIISPERVTYKDTLSYFAINLDANSKRTVCRLYFNKDKKYLGLMDKGAERKVEIQGLSDIYRFADALCQSVRYVE